MKNRNFGTVSQPVSEIGLGCWQFGGDFGPMSDENAAAILSAAVESGIDFFDTADVYGAGRSETLIGKFLQSRSSDASDSIKVVTKFGRDGSVYPDKYSESAMRSSIDAARKRLGVDTLDCLQLHCVPLAVMQKGEIFGWLRTLKSEGVIHDFGASVETVDEALFCVKQEGIASLQVIFNVFRQKPIAELFPEAISNKVSIIVRLPLASGLLAGKYTTETTFTEGDHRNYNSDGQKFSVGETFAGIPFPIGVGLANELREMLPTEMTMAQATQRWILDHQAVTTIITGASSPQQVIDNAATSELPPLSPELHQRLAEFYQTKVRQHIRGVY